MTFSIPTHKCGLVIGRGESLMALPFLCLALPLPGLHSLWSYRRGEREGH